MTSETDFIEYLNKLSESNDASSNVSQESHSIINSMRKYFENQIKFKKQTLHFKDKFNVIMSFIKFVKTICLHSNIKIYGSFVRTIFEKIFVSTADIGYADPVNHDIDLVLYDGKEMFNTDIRHFYDFISLMQIVSNTDKYDFNFYGFKIIDIIEKTIRPNDIREEAGFGKKFLIDIPHYVIILQKDEIKIKIDMLCYKITNYDFDTWQNEFNINSLTMTQDGIFGKNMFDMNSDSYNFYETINSIINKTAISNLPFDILVRHFTHKSRAEKINICNQIIWFFANRMKIISLGYTNIYSDNNFFDFQIENEEPCPVTGNEPPYIKIKLTCNHYMSMMALTGLVNIRSSEWSESIKCPMCRKDIDFAFIENKPTKIQTPKQPEKELESIDNYEIKDKIFSDENIQYITTILKNQSLGITAPPNDPPANQRTGLRERVRPIVGRRTNEDYQMLQRTTNIGMVDVD